MTGQLRHGARRTDLCIFATRKALSTAMMLLALAGCAVDSAYLPPGFSFAAKYAGVDRAVPRMLADEAWWQRLHDPLLNQLIIQALRDNPSLAAAEARIAAAQAAFDATPGLVTLAPTAELTRTTATGGSPVTAGKAALTFDWLLDPGGSNRAERRAGAGRVEVAQAEAAAARLAVIRSLATAYVELRYRQQRLSLQEQQLRSSRQTRAMTEKLSDAQAATRLDLTRSKARMADVETGLPALRAAIAAGRNQIAVLAGVAPGQLGINLDLRSGQPRPEFPADIGIPADLMRNRPDIVAAERRYYVALAEVSQAEAALYPRLSLTGTLSATAFAGGGISREAIFGPSIRFPVFPGRPARAGVEAARARVAEAHANWRSTVLGALDEVEQSLLDYRAAVTAEGSAGKAVRLYRETLELTRSVFETSDATLGDLIDAERDLFNAEATLADLRLRRASAFIDLNIRLGAGHGVRIAPGG